MSSHGNRFSRAGQELHFRPEQRQTHAESGDHHGPDQNLPENGDGTGTADELLPRLHRSADRGHGTMDPRGGTD